MKRFLLFTFALFAICSTTFGEDSFPIEGISLPQNTDADLAVKFSFDNSKQYTSYSFTIELPDGLEFVESSTEGEAEFTLGDCYSAAPTITANLINKKTVNVGCMGTTAFKSNTGVLLTLKIKLSANSTLAVGASVSGTLSNAKKVTTTLDEITITGTTTFDVTIAEPSDFRTILDETSTTAPAAATGVDVRVKRTIKANTWSTICLPFAMTEAQVKSAFGEDVVLGNFSSWSSEEDNNSGDIVSISLVFTKVTPTTIEANHPYIIKVSKAFDNFTVDQVNIAPEVEPTIQVGKNKATRGYFTGTYVASTTVPENDLFLSGGLFYYSKGKTKMKGYRGYFELADNLTDKTIAGSRAMISFDDGDGTTRIQNADFLRPKTGRVYSVTGRFIGENVDMKSLPKGLYIVDGVKIVNE